MKEMYHILETSGGQPVIFYIKESNVTLYSIASGKVHNQGNIFTDVKKDFHLFAPSQIITYISIENKLVIVKIDGMTFKEVYILPLHNEDSLENSLFNYVEINNSINIIYLSHNLNDSTFSVRCINCGNFIKDFLLFKSESIVKNIYTFLFEDNFGIFLEYSKGRELKIFNKDFNILDYSVMEPSNQNELTADDIPNSIDDKVIPSFKKKIKDLENALKGKDYEIASLKEVQDSIKHQYSELADYAGKLQEEARKLRLE